MVEFQIFQLHHIHYASSIPCFLWLKLLLQPRFEDKKSQSSVVYLPVLGGKTHTFGWQQNPNISLDFPCHSLQTPSPRVLLHGRHRAVIAVTVGTNQNRCVWNSGIPQNDWFSGEKDDNPSSVVLHHISHFLTNPMWNGKSSRSYSTNRQFQQWKVSFWILILSHPGAP